MFGADPGLLAFDVGPDGDFFAWPAAPRIDPETGAAPPAKFDPGAPIRLHHVVAGRIETIELPSRAGGYGFVQSLGVNLLVVSNDDGQDANGGIFDRSGRLLESLFLGVGIADVKTVSGDRIFVSYFDEGVFSEDEKSSEGYCCFDSSGSLLLGYNGLAERDGHPFIEDCYAINAISDDEIWLYYYSDFPLVRLKGLAIDRIVAGIPVHGARAFAIDGDRALFAGSYAGGDELRLVSLKDAAVRTFKPVTPAGNAIRVAKAWGRGPILYLATEEALFSIDIREL